MLQNPNDINEEKILQYGKVLQNQIIPKFQDSISDESIRKKWEAFFNHILPQSNLNYKSEEAFLNDKNITKKDVVKNSIQHVFHDMNNKDLSDICTHFLALVDTLKIRVLLDCNKAVYVEIIQVMEYIKKIKELLARYKTPSSDYKGTAHRSSSLNKIVKTQINMLESRIDGTFFRIQNDDEIEQTEVALKLLRKSQEEQYKNIMEYLNYSKLLYGLDMKMLGASQNEIIALEQVLDFYNGVKSTPKELVRSLMIYCDIVFEKSKLKSQEKADHILFIANHFFFIEFKEANKKRNSLTFNKSHIKKSWRVKTILHQLPIFAFATNKSNDFLQEFYEIGLNDMLGLQNLFEPDNPMIDEVSDMHLLRNLVNVRKVFNLTKDELKALLFFFELIQVT